MRTRILTVAGLILASALVAVAASAVGRPAADAHSVLAGRAVLPGSTVREGSAVSGAFFSAADRANATRNGVPAPATGPVFAAQPVQGFSAVIPTGEPGAWWALSDNGYGARANSFDWELRVNRIRPRFATGAAAPGAVELAGGFGLSDPRGHVPWRIVCDPGRGRPLPPFAFNALPATPPPLCGDPARRILTGGDFDPESMQLGADGTFWFGDEFGPFLLNTDAQGRLLRAPIPLPGVKSPQNPTLDLDGGERPNLAASKGFEGMGVSPDRRFLYPLLEGAVTGDDPSELRISEFDTRRAGWTGRVLRLRLELPSGLVNLAGLLRQDGTPAYPGTTPPPPNTGKSAIGELTMLDAGRAVLIERDNGGDAPIVPRFKKLFLLDLGLGRGHRHRHGGDGRVGKTLLADLLAVPDRDGTGADGDFFRFPFNTIESVHPVDDHTLLVANDNNYPFSNGRSFSRGGGVGTTPLRADDNELILIRLGQDLDVDRRILDPKTRR
jgi:hypothetical protein